MQIIWYNSESNKYEFGKEEAYKAETQSSQDPYIYTKLMELDSNSESVAGKVIKQLNIASELPLMYASRG